MARRPLAQTPKVRQLTHAKVGVISRIETPSGRRLAWTACRLFLMARLKAAPVVGSIWDVMGWDGMGWGGID